MSEDTQTEAVRALIQRRERAAFGRGLLLGVAIMVAAVLILRR